MIDDADGYVFAAFHPEESTAANMEVLKTYISTRGIFMALYTDRASHFTTTRHGGLHQEVTGEEQNTQIAMALEDLGIAHVTASSPQAKGRIERLFRFFQDRLIKEMRLGGVTDYQSANRFLRETFLPWYNERYTFQVESTYRELPEGIDLDLVFSLRHSRKARKDNTISYEKTVYQLFPAHGVKDYGGRWIDVRKTLDGRVHLFYQEKPIPYGVLKKEAYRKLREEEVLRMRGSFPEEKSKRRYVPPQDHPWRRSWKQDNVTFQTRNKV